MNTVKFGLFHVSPYHKLAFALSKHGVDGLDRKAMGEGTHQGYHVVCLTHSEEPENEGNWNTIQQIVH